MYKNTIVINYESERALDKDEQELLLGIAMSTIKNAVKEIIAINKLPKVTKGYRDNGQIH